MKALNLNKLTLFKNFPKEQIQIVIMSNVSDYNWNIARPHINAMKKNLKNFDKENITVFITFSYSFTRTNSLESKITLNEVYEKLDKDHIEVLLKNLDCNNESLQITELYKPLIHLTVEAKGDPVLESNIPSLNVSLKLNCFRIEENENTTHFIDYSQSYFDFKVLNQFNTTTNGKNGAFFITISDLVSDASSGHDVIGFYVSTIYFIGKFIRAFISGEETRIILAEMPQPENLISLCEGIKISRYRHDFKKEEYFYYILIDLMRSPEIIKIITKSSIKKLKEKEEIEKKNN